MRSAGDVILEAQLSLAVKTELARHRDPFAMAANLYWEEVRGDLGLSTHPVTLSLKRLPELQGLSVRMERYAGHWYLKLDRGVGTAVVSINLTETVAGRLAEEFRNGWHSQLSHHPLRHRWGCRCRRRARECFYGLVGVSVRAEEWWVRYRTPSAP